MSGNLKGVLEESMLRLPCFLAWLLRLSSLHQPEVLEELHQSLIPLCHGLIKYLILGLKTQATWHQWCASQQNIASQAHRLTERHWPHHSSLLAHCTVSSMSICL